MPICMVRFDLGIDRQSARRGLVVFSAGTAVEQESAPNELFWERFVM